jgi:hypothetical protein
MKIGDIVRYLPSTLGSPCLGLIIGAHRTRNQYGWEIEFYHIQWFNDGDDGWTEANSVTHESLECIEEYNDQTKK